MHIAKRSRFVQILCLLLSLALALLVMLPDTTQYTIRTVAASVDYPAQLMNLAAKNNAAVMTQSGMSVKMTALGSDLSCSWRLDRVGAEATGTYFKFTNASTGQMLTPSGKNVSAGTAVVMGAAESAKCQHWFVVPVGQDHLGNDLYYKVVNYENTSLALTQGTSGMTLANYTGADNQLFLLNADGLQGFAGYCKNDGTGVKAGDIGGLFGEIVEVSSFADLKKYAEASAPYTIIVKGRIDGGSNYKIDGQNHYYNPDGRIYVTDNKTIVGSYGSHVTYNVALCTKSGSGKGNNIIIRNLEMQHDKDSNGNDNIIVYFGAGQNLWVDHVTFVGHADYNKASSGQPDYDKFLACCYDADYCTISDSSFGLHEYGLILGYPDDTADVQKKYDGYPRMTISGNKFYQTLTRGPGLMRWGYFHSFNNYVNTFSMAYTVHSGCDIYAENCVYENGGNVICDWNQITYAGAYAESGSKFSNCSRTKQGEGTSGNPSYSKASTWRPNSHYSYTTLTADNAKTYTTKYAGSQSSSDNWMYLRYGAPGASTPSAPVITPVNFTDGAAFRIKNANSGLYLEVAGASAENGANADQWGSDGSEIHNIWKLFSAGDNYYYLASCVGDGGTYVLDVAGRKTADGTNIDIYQYNGGTNQQFLITDNGDGTYKLRTRVTGEASAVEVGNADKTSGANVQQWAINGANCQDWIFEPVTDPGTAMKTDVLYTFENVNSGQVMDIAAAKMENGTNVQQWGGNDFDCQKWQLHSFPSGNYYWIRSQQDLSFALRAEGSANGSNIDIAPYSSKDSAQLFRFSKNLDGSYHIITHASKDKCFVEVDAASKESGANVQQYAPTNSTCQSWNLTTAPIPAPVIVEEPSEETPSEEKPSEETPSEEKPSEEIPSEEQPSEEPPVPSDTIKGDINADGSVSVLDLVSLQKYVLAMNSFDENQFAQADLSGDGVVDVFDLALLKRALTAK